MKNAKRAGSLILGLALAAVMALPAAAADFNLPKDSCFSDTADILSEETEQVVNDLDAVLTEKTGAQIGVYTVQYIGNTTMEEYANQVANAWGIGDKTKDNGVVLVLVPGSDKYWCAQGEGLEDSLTSATISRILSDNLEPNWVKGDYNTGTQKTVKALAKELGSIYGVDLNIDSIVTDGGQAALGGTSAGSAGSTGSGLVPLLVIGLIIFVIVLFIVMIPKRRYYGRRRGYYAPPPPPMGFGPRYSRRSYRRNRWDDWDDRDDHHHGPGGGGFGGGFGGGGFGGSSGGSSFGGGGFSGHSGGGFSGGFGGHSGGSSPGGGSFRGGGAGRG